MTRGTPFEVDQPSEDAPVGATFHEVVFGEGDDVTRYGFEAFRDLSLRQRVRLLMTKRSQFLTADGEEISRDVAMRFRQRAQSSEHRAASASSSASSEPEDRVARLIRLLRESTLEHELRGCVKLAEQLELDDPKHRADLAAGLLRTAKLIEREQGPTPTSAAAIRRYASLVPTQKLTELGHFLAPGNEAETMQATLHALWTALSVDQDHGLGILAVRTRQLLNKFLDADWLCTNQARALTTELLLVNSVLTPKTDEHGLSVVFNRARNLGEAIPLELARADIEEALGYARARDLETVGRLELLAKLARGDG